MIEAKGKLVFETKGIDGTGWLVTDIDAVLAWYGVQKLNAMGKVAKMEKWRELQRNNVQPKEFEQWTDDLEQQLITASSTDITLGDTAVGRYEQKKREDFKRAAKKFTEEEWVAMTADRSENTAAMAEDNDGTMNEEETE